MLQVYSIKHKYGKWQLFKMPITFTVLIKFLFSYNSKFKSIIKIFKLES